MTPDWHDVLLRGVTPLSITDCSSYYEMAAVQMHDLEHNLNLAHGGRLDGLTYTDRTCLMGNPLWGDDLGRMCFNPVKTFWIAKGSRRRVVRFLLVWICPTRLDSEAMSG